MVVIVFGLPGSGKSYFASRLAALLDAAYISSDRVRKRMFVEKTYTEQEKLSVYNEMLIQAKAEARQNKSVVLDATFYKKSVREKFVDEFGNARGVFFIEVTAGEQLLFERLAKEREDSDAGVEVYKKLKEQWDPMPEEHLMLQSAHDNLDGMLKKATAYLLTKDDERTNR